MKLKEIIRIFEHVIPREWAMPDDPVGLHVGDPEQKIKKVYVGLEASTALLHKSIEKKAELVLVHHPLLYRPINRVVESDPVQRIVRRLVQNDMALYVMHTNMDFHPEGMAKIWAKKLGCSTSSPLCPKPQACMHKLVVFCPQDHTDKIRLCLTKAGAGIIGEYDTCSFLSRGIGTFRGSKYSNPVIGQSGMLERAEEDRLEMIFPSYRKESVIKALAASHPYEEPAYDLYAMDDFLGLNHALWTAEFDTPLSWEEFLQKVTESLPLKPEFIMVQPKNGQMIKKIAISTGSGNSFIGTVQGLDVDCYLTGEVGYHQLWDAKEREINVITVGHGVSESLFAEAAIALLQKRIPEVTWISETE